MPISRPLQWLRGSGEHPPWLLRCRSSKWFILLTITMAVFTDIFLYAVIVPVIPFALNARAGVAPNEIQSWVSILIAVYGGSLALFSPICGWIADRTSSRQPPLLLGLLALGGATVMLNLGSSIAVLVVGRILQGLSAAVVWVVGLALLADSIDTTEVGQMMGHMFVGLSLGFLLGPLLGGVVFAEGGYNWVFGMTYILIGVDIAMRLLMVEKKVANKWIETDRQFSAIAMTTVAETGDRKDIGRKDEEGIKPIPDEEKDAIKATGSTTQSPTADVSKPSEIPSKAKSIQKKMKLPPVITLLKSRRLLSSLWATVVLSTLLTQFDSVLPLHVRHAFNWTSTGAGLAFLPLVIPSFATGALGWLVDRYGGRWFATAGFIIFTPFEILLRLVTHNTLGQKVLLCVLLAFIGFTMDLVIAPVMAEIMHVVASKERERPGLFGKNGAYAQAYGLFNFAWAAGCLIGPIWAGYVNERAGWGTMTWTLALLSIVTAIPTAIWCGGYAFKKRRTGNGDGGGTGNDDIHDLRRS